ncbi:4452_t:CDS:2, partial [Funneliformis geosporum]
LVSEGEDLWKEVVVASRCGQPSAVDKNEFVYDTSYQIQDQYSMSGQIVMIVMRIHCGSSFPGLSGLNPFTIFNSPSRLLKQQSLWTVIVLVLFTSIQKMWIKSMCKNDLSDEDSDSETDIQLPDIQDKNTLDVYVFHSLTSSKCKLEEILLEIENDAVKKAISLVKSNDIIAITKSIWRKEATKWMKNVSQQQLLGITLITFFGEVVV